MALSPSTQSATAVRLRGVRRDFGGGVLALADIDLAITPGEFVAILGPSGCGKTTLLRIVAGLDHATAGEVSVESHDRLAYVFQDAHLLPWRNALRNASLPLELRGLSRMEQRDRAMEALQSVGLADFARKYPAQLSGGMRMRVSLARALVTEPRLLLLDEPFAALDEITRAGLDVQLRQLWLDRPMTVIFVTHSITEAAFLADRAIVMTRRPGQIALDTPIDLGRERAQSLRGEARFAYYTRLLLDALHTGGA